MGRKEAQKRAQKAQNVSYDFARLNLNEICALELKNHFCAFCFFCAFSWLRLPVWWRFGPVFIGADGLGLIGTKPIRFDVGHDEILGWHRRARQSS
jgi:hypothetical protein